MQGEKQGKGQASRGCLLPLSFAPFLFAFARDAFFLTLKGIDRERSVSFTLHFPDKLPGGG